MKVRCIDAEGHEDVLRKGGIYEGEFEFNNMFQEERWKIKGIGETNGLAFKKFRFEEVKKLTFREVIANIKEGEVWSSKSKTIEMYQGRILIGMKNGKKLDSYNICFSKNVMYSLKSKEYTFEEAFKAYEEGKEIESIHSGYRYKKVNGVDLYTRGGKEWYEEDDFEIDEIREAWYINE